VVSFTSRPLYPQGRNPGTNWIGGWVDPRAGLEAEVKRKIPSSRRESKPGVCGGGTVTGPLWQSDQNKPRKWLYLYVCLFSLFHFLSVCHKLCHTPTANDTYWQYVGYNNTKHKPFSFLTKSKLKAADKFSGFLMTSFTNTWTLCRKLPERIPVNNVKWQCMAVSAKQGNLYISCAWRRVRGSAPASPKYHQWKKGKDVSFHKGS
jgi:hypothetical protein